MNNPLMLVLVFFVLSMLSTVGLWKIPPSLGREKRPAVGFYHRLSQLWRLVVLAAAWWHECVSGVSAEVFDFFFVPLLRRGHPRLAHLVGNFFSMRVLSLVTFHWLVWLIAKKHLQAKWQIELDLANFDYWQAKCQREEEGKKS